MIRLWVCWNRGKQNHLIVKTVKTKMEERKMKKRVISIIIALMLIGALFAACGAEPISTGGAEAPAPAPAAEAPAAEAPAPAPAAQGAFVGDPSQKYYMNVFLVGAEFWKGCWDGFADAAAQLNVSAEITGSMDYDAIQQVETFEQILTQNPAGILVCPIDEDSMTISINKALDMGVPVVTFYNDAPETDRLTIYGTSPENEGALAAYSLMDMIGGEGEIAIITRPQENISRRIAEFEKIIAAEFPKVKIVQSIYAESDTTKAAEMTSGILQANPNLKAVVPFGALEAIGVAQAKKETGIDIKIITFEADPGVLDLIREGLIDATIGIDGYSTGYFPLIDLYIAKNQLNQPYTDWRKNPWSPLPMKVSFGNDLVTIKNADDWEQPTW